MMQIIKSIVLITIILGVFAGCTSSNPQTTTEPEVTPVATSVVENKKENLLKNHEEVFAEDNIYFAACEIDKSGDIINNHFMSYDKYRTLTLYDFGNNIDSTVEVVIIPRDTKVSLELCSVEIDEDGNLVVRQMLDSGINEPFRFRYDDYESIMPQYGIIIENSSYSGIIPIVHSGMDGSLAMNSDYSVVIK